MGIVRITEEDVKKNVRNYRINYIPNFRLSA